MIVLDFNEVHLLDHVICIIDIISSNGSNVISGKRISISNNSTCTSSIVVIVFGVVLVMVVEVVSIS